MLKKIERYRRYAMRRLVYGRVEHLRVTAFKSPMNSKNEFTIHATYESGAIADGGSQIVRIPKEARTRKRDEFITESTEKVVKHFVSQGYSLINPDFAEW